MEYTKIIVAILVAGVLSGCKTLQAYRPLGYEPMGQVYQRAQAGEPARREIPQDELPDLEISEDKIRVMTSMGDKMFFDAEDAYAKGYRSGVKENINLLASEFVGNNFPYYYWQAPLVQKVFMPSRIVGGCYVPAHYEYVVILPGEWKEKYGYPIGNKKEQVKAASYFQAAKQSKNLNPQEPKSETEQGTQEETPKESHDEKTD